MSININLGNWSSVFAVPSKVADEILKFSDGVKLKVLLYVLRNSDNELTNEMISSGTGINVTDIPEALDFWVSMGIFSKENSVYSPVKSENSLGEVQNVNSHDIEIAKEENIILKSNNTVEEIAKDVEENKTKFTMLRPQKPDYVFTAQRLAVDEELKFIVEETQNSLGKVLSNSDISTLLMLKDTCGLPLDVILMLIQYCISIEKANMRTIEKIGIEWANDGIYSIEAAENKIKQTKQRTVNFSIISSAFGLKNMGSPTKKQLEYSDRWIGEWKFSPEMLREAYERCVDTKGMMKLSYIDGILKRWNANNIKSIEQLRSFEKAPNKSRVNHSSYNIDELEKIDTLDDI